MWSEVTDLAKNKMGIAVALSLPENDSTVIREQVMEEVKLDDLKKGIKLPEEILCFELLSSANISKPEKMLILSGLNFEKKDDLFDQAKKSLKKFKGELASNDDIVGATATLKLEPTFVASQEEALVTDNFQYQRGRSWPRGRGFRGAANYRGRKTDRGGSARGN